jgi:protein transport protein SEC24
MQPPPLQGMGGQQQQQMPGMPLAPHMGGMPPQGQQMQGQQMQGQQMQGQQMQGMPPPQGMMGGQPGMGMGGQPGQPGFGGPPPPSMGTGMGTMGGGYPGAVAGGMSPQNIIEEFSSLQLGGGTGTGAGGDQGVDPAQFPRPGDDVPNPNTELSCDPRYLRLTCGALPVNQSVKQRFGLPIACIVRPLIPGENVPVAQFGSTGEP